MLTALNAADRMKGIWVSTDKSALQATPPYQPKHETFKRTERKGRGLPRPAKPKALKALGQIAFNKKWEKLGAVASVRPQDGLWQVDVPGHAAMHGADLALLDLCVQSMSDH